MTITNVIIKTQIGNETGVWMTSCPEAVGWEFGDFERGVSWDPTLGRARPTGSYGMRSAFVGSDSTVSIVKIVSLSSCQKTKVKKLINVSYLNNGESPVFRDFPASVYLCSWTVTIQQIAGKDPSPNLTIRNITTFGNDSLRQNRDWIRDCVWDCGICSTPHQTWKCGTRPFLVGPDTGP